MRTVCEAPNGAMLRRGDAARGIQKRGSREREGGVHGQLLQCFLPTELLVLAGVP